MEEGTLKARFLHDLKDYEMKLEEALDSGMKLEAGQWSNLKIRYDLRQLVITVNGVSSKPIPLPGPGMHDTPGSLGGHGPHGFHGLIRKFAVSYGIP